MRSAGTINVAKSAAARIIEGSSAGTVILVKLTPNSPPTNAAIAVATGVQVANESVPNGSIVGDVVVGTENGVAVVVYEDPANDHEIDVWLSALKVSLEQHGLSGSIGSSSTWGPELQSLYRREELNRYPTTFAGYEVESYEVEKAMIGWQVGTDATSRLAEHIGRWVEASERRPWAQLWRGSLTLPASQVAEFVRSSSRYSSAGRSIVLVDDDCSSYEEVTLSNLGIFVSQSIDPTVSWQQLLTRQIEMLVLDPAALDVGMIKNAPARTRSWDGASIIFGDHQHSTVRMPMDYMFNRHLWSEYVIDASGVNLLTSQHLEKANDLSRWGVEEVARDRYLVTAADLAAWYQDRVPDQQVIAEARADFGNVILTWDAILANPGPLTQTEAAIVGR